MIGPCGDCGRFFDEDRLIRGFCVSCYAFLGRGHFHERMEESLNSSLAEDYSMDKNKKKAEVI